MSGWELLACLNTVAIFALWVSVKELENKNDDRR